MSLLLDANKDEISTVNLADDLRAAKFYSHLDGSGNYIKLPIPKALKDVFERAADTIESLADARDEYKEAARLQAERADAHMAQNQSWKDAAETLRAKCEEAGRLLQTRTEDCREAVTKLGEAMQEIARTTHERDIAITQRADQHRRPSGSLQKNQHCPFHMQGLLTHDLICT